MNNVHENVRINPMTSHRIRKWSKAGQISLNKYVNNGWINGFCVCVYALFSRSISRFSALANRYILSVFALWEFISVVSISHSEYLQMRIDFHFPTKVFYAFFPCSLVPIFLSLFVFFSSTYSLTHSINLTRIQIFHFVFLFFSLLWNVVLSGLKLKIHLLATSQRMRCVSSQFFFCVETLAWQINKSWLIRCGGRNSQQLNAIINFWN